MLLFYVFTILYIFIIILEYPLSIMKKYIVAFVCRRE